MRKSARNQPLPQEESDYLQTLSRNPQQLKARAKALYAQGWTLSAIGAPLNRSRSTIRFWIQNAPDLHPTNDHPTLPQPQDRSYQRKRPPSPGIPQTAQHQIQTLAPKARNYRARLPQHHPSTQANQELTHLCQSLHQTGVPIQELATAAGVTYRAMYRRVHA